MTNHTTKCLIILIALTGIIAARDADASTIYVNAAGNGPSPNGASWQTAFISLQDALDAAAPGDQIWVAQGLMFLRGFTRLTASRGEPPVSTRRV